MKLFAPITRIFDYIEISVTLCSFLSCSVFVIIETRGMLNIGDVSNETNTDVRMYT